MTNERIAYLVWRIVSEFDKDSKIKEEDKEVIKSGVELVINLLQNINTIASSVNDISHDLVSNSK